MELEGKGRKERKGNGERRRRRDNEKGIEGVIKMEGRKNIGIEKEKEGGNWEGIP